MLAKREIVITSKTVWHYTMYISTCRSVYLFSCVHQEYVSCENARFGGIFCEGHVWIELWNTFTACHINKRIFTRLWELSGAGIILSICKYHCLCTIFWNIRRCMHKHTYTVYPKKYAHGFVVLCFVVVMQSFIMNSHEVFIHIHQGCFAGTGAIVRLPQCQWSKPDGYGKISQCITTTKHSKAKTVCIFLEIYCTYMDSIISASTSCPFHESKQIWLKKYICIFLNANIIPQVLLKRLLARASFDVC